MCCLQSNLRFYAQAVGTSSAASVCVGGLTSIPSALGLDGHDPSTVASYRCPGNKGDLWPPGDTTSDTFKRRPCAVITVPSQMAQ